MRQVAAFAGDAALSLPTTDANIGALPCRRQDSLLSHAASRLEPISPMTKTLHSAEEIQAEVARLIHEHRDVRASAAVIQVPLPTQQRADGTGLNWWMSGFGNGFGFQEVIGSAVAVVGKRWNLRAE